MASEDVGGPDERVINLLDEWSHDTPAEVARSYNEGGGAEMLYAFLERHQADFTDGTERELRMLLRDLDSTGMGSAEQNFGDAHPQEMLRKIQDHILPALRAVLSTHTRQRMARGPPERVPGRVSEVAARTAAERRLRKFWGFEV